MTQICNQIFFQHHDGCTISLAENEISTNFGCRNSQPQVLNKSNTTRYSVHTSFRSFITRWYEVFQHDFITNEPSKSRSRDTWEQEYKLRQKNGTKEPVNTWSLAQSTNQTMQSLVNLLLELIEFKGNHYTDRNNISRAYHQMEWFLQIAKGWQ